MNTTPLPNSDEVAHQLGASLAAGIRYFYNLTQPHELLSQGALRKQAAQAGIPPMGMRCRRFPVPDRGLPAPAAWLKRS